MARGNQRDKAREANQKKLAGQVRTSQYAQGSCTAHGITVGRTALIPLPEGWQSNDRCRDGPQQGGRGRKDEREAGRRYAYLDSTRYSLNNHSLYKQPTPSALPTRLLRSKSLTHDTRYCELSTIIRLEEHTAGRISV